ncbi:MAG: hypothetical protein HC939_06635 [Pleurocapsa sp. SU_5_0]|nr:hypothetical protein [Pleurocapsa sp. SU_5_0]NJO96755.1 hypothetical protein [Pleurocapsa sp. CRU_1_2]NJR45663.1 hypothetical protein [Hyellaceae cyanobacterium CSU_1_1]
MDYKKYNLPQRLVTGATKKSQEAQVPTAIGGDGQIGSNLNIRWTPRRRVIAATVLGVPFLLATAVAFKSGYTLMGIILVGVAVFVGLMYLALRYIEANEF